MIAFQNYDIDLITIPFNNFLFLIIFILFDFYYKYITRPPHIAKILTMYININILLITLFIL